MLIHTFGLANRLYSLEEHNPHHFLGLHPYQDKKIIRLFRPDANEVFIEINGEAIPMDKIDDLGLFEKVVSNSLTYKDYKVWHVNGDKGCDPYAFLPTVGQMDQYLFAKGVHYQLYDALGGRLCEHQGVKGAKFSVWAPGAKGVSLVADFNHWNGRANPMRSLGFSGIWEIFIPGAKEGLCYKFEIKTQEGNILLKTDPFGAFSEVRPLNASRLADLHYGWNDHDWIERRAQQGYNIPMNIYEVHLGSWKKKGEHFLTYRELAHELADYCKEMGFTHVELMPIAEHPLDESWGYQTTGFFAPTSRFGEPKDFKYFVDHLHTHGIGVFVDWVGGHFPDDAHGLSRFDGTAIYEHEDPRQGWHPHWHTHIFNYGRHEVSNFLIANALYWFDHYHIDGLRVDAVASMLYLDYGRNDGEWIPNQYGGKENIEAIEFLRHLNSIVHQRFKGVKMIAEESTAFGGVTQPVESLGLGFDYKWNMGWMNDTLRYISKDCIYRQHHQNELTFSLLYAFSEKFILVLSHDEVVHGKKSIMGRMQGDMWQQFANARTLYGYLMCHPGKKLLFMGNEIGMWNEWNCKHQIEWFLTQFPNHDSLKRTVKDLNHLYLNHPALWEDDFSYNGFEWVDFSDRGNSVLSYLRKGKGETLLCIHNFSPNYYSDYKIPLKGVKKIQELLNTDALIYSGTGKVNEYIDIKPELIQIQLAPLSTMIFKVDRN